MGIYLQGLNKMGKFDNTIVVDDYLGWEHINLTSDYILQQRKTVEQGKCRPLRSSEA